MKRFIALCCAGLLICALPACGDPSSTSSATPSVPQVTGSIVGKITALNGATVTLQLGELTAPDASVAQPEDIPTDGDTSQAPPEKPDGQDNGTPPEKPNDDEDSGSPPEKPEGEADSSAAPEPPDAGQPPTAGGVFTAGEESATVDLSHATITKETQGGETAVTVSDLATGDVIEVTMGDDTTAASAVIKWIGGAPNGSDDEQVQQGTSANTIDQDSTAANATYTSDGDDENALRITNAAATLDGVTVDKAGGASSNPGEGDFYGINAALLATDGATLTLKNSAITSNAQGGNGVFCYGKGTTVTLSDTTITTQKDNSGGIQTTGGGTTNADSLTVTTSGNSSAAIRSDRGGGTVRVTRGSYTSKGYNSPAVYSTADIAVTDATLTAEHSEALVVEGKNSITLQNCVVSGNMSDTKGTSSSENVHNVMLYQSMSGDAETGTARLAMTGGKLTCHNGDAFYVTNTQCTLSLSGVTLDNEDQSGKLLRVTGNSGTRGWGTAGKNGAQVTFTADGQVLEGAIEVDTISTLDMTLKNNSVWTGMVRIVDNAEGGDGVNHNAILTIEEGSTWTLTGDCTVTRLINHGTIEFNGHTITLADGTVLQG